MPILASPTKGREALVARARRWHRERLERLRFFPAQMFGEPAWDILLALYFSERIEDVTVTRLTEYARVPMTSLLRWIEHLEQADFVHSKRRTTDRRIHIICLSEKGRSTMDRFFETLSDAAYA